MKSTDKIIIASGLAYGILFYQQDFGINFLIYSILQLIALFYISTKEKRNSNWWLSFIGVASASIGVFLYGSILAVFANVISLFVLAAFTIESRNSIFMSILNSCYAVITGIIHIINQLNSKLMEQSGLTKTAKGFKHTLIILASFAVALIFFFLYRNSNEAFKVLTDNIDWSFISWGWIGFTLLGYYFIYNMYTNHNLGKLSQYDRTTPNTISPDASNKMNEMMSLESEKLWAKSLLIMLNMLLLLVLVTEAMFYFGVYEITQDIDLSKEVHQGVNALILSIILAVGVILFFFKGRLNFIKENNILKSLAMIWIALNIILVLLTGFKNIAYISDFFLTYKRIGVFFYLICCLIGLVYTFTKIKDLKSNWFLVRKVSWAFYAIAVFTPLVNWDAIIINYNFDHSTEDVTHLDLDYLLSLPVENYPLINSRLQNHPAYTSTENEMQLQEILVFKQTYEELDWRSFSLRKYLAYKIALTIDFSKAPPLVDNSYTSDFNTY